jgi:hypothetical protein
MKRREWIAGIAVLALLGATAWLLMPRPDVAFVTVRQASGSITAEGFRCTSDRADGQLENGFLVTREETNWREVNVLPKAGPMGPEWKGKVWITGVVPNQIWNMPDGAAAKLWGGVYAYGDGAFLAEIEGALQRGGRPQI